jgi:hypothetical protein
MTALPPRKLPNRRRRGRLRPMTWADRASRDDYRLRRGRWWPRGKLQ